MLYAGFKRITLEALVRPEKPTSEMFYVQKAVQKGVDLINGI